MRALADEAYQKWTNASPVEKLSIEPPKEVELETGRWGRVNSRGASMIMLAIPESVRPEMVQRRSTGSVTSLVFRLLTVYQPGGQQEKVMILQNLQQPALNDHQECLGEGCRSKLPDLFGEKPSLSGHKAFLRVSREVLPPPLGRV